MVFCRQCVGITSVVFASESVFVGRIMNDGNGQDGACSSTTHEARWRSGYHDTDTDDATRATQIDRDAARRGAA